jgi:hypothetical protein
MKRTLLFTLIAVTACGPGRAAAAPGGTGSEAVAAIGFHGTAAPLGLRWWLPGRIAAIDAGVGYQSNPSLLYDDETLATWTFDAGVPVALRRWDRVHLLTRPGVIWQSEQIERTGPPEAFATENLTTFELTAELEAEVFLADRFSVSAAHGVSYRTVDRPGAGSLSTFGTTGGNFTAVGFHVYFLAGGR